MEFALCLPLMLVLLFFGVETGRLLTDFQVVTKSLRDSARYLSHVGITCPGSAASSGPLSTYIDDPANEIPARHLALTGTPDSPRRGAPLLLPYWNGAGNLTMTVNCIPIGTYQGIYQGAALVPQITVSAAVPFTFLWGTTFSNVGGVTINLSHTETHVGA